MPLIRVIMRRVLVQKLDVFSPTTFFQITLILVSKLLVVVNLCVVFGGIFAGT